MAVEAFELEGMVRAVGKQAPPMRQVHQPTPDCRIGDDLTAAAILLLSTIRRIYRDQKGCATYLFVDRDGNAYAISERRAVALHWVREHIDWLVGRYLPPSRSEKTAARRTGKPFMEPTVDGLVEDLADHLRTLMPVDDLYRRTTD